MQGAQAVSTTAQTERQQSRSKTIRTLCGNSGASTVVKLGRSSVGSPEASMKNLPAMPLLKLWNRCLRILAWQSNPLSLKRPKPEISSIRMHLQLRGNQKGQIVGQSKTSKIKSLAMHGAKSQTVGYCIRSAARWPPNVDRVKPYVQALETHPITAYGAPLPLSLNNVGPELRLAFVCHWPHLDREERQRLSHVRHLHGSHNLIVPTIRRKTAADAARPT